MFLAAFVCFGIEAPIDASNMSAILPSILSELFADHYFPKSTKFTSPLVFVHDTLRRSLPSQWSRPITLYYTQHWPEGARPYGRPAQRRGRPGGVRNGQETGNSTRLFKDSF